MSPKKFTPTWIFILFACGCPAYSAFADGDSLTAWEASPPIQVNAQASSTEVAANEIVTIRLSATDADTWTKYIPGQSDGAMSEANFLGAGTEPDKCTVQWSNTGGEWVSAESNSGRRWRAPKETGSYTITILVDDIAPDVNIGSRDDASVTKEIRIDVGVAKLDYIEAVDANDSSRRSQSLLQMASKGGSRIANVKAYKEDPKSKWAEEEPRWSGLKTAKGIEEVNVVTAKTGREIARAGGNTAGIDIEIKDAREKEIRFTEKDYRKLKDLINKVAKTLGQDKKGVDSDVTMSGAIWKVDKIQSPLCDTSGHLTAGGRLALTWKPINFRPTWLKIPEAVKEYVDYDLSVEAGLKLNLNAIRLLKDARYEPPDFNPAGGATLAGEVVATAKLIARLPGDRLVIEGSLSGIATASGSFLMVRSELTGKYKIGEIAGSAKVTVINKRKQVLWSGIIKLVIFEGIDDEGSVDFANFLN